MAEICRTWRTLRVALALSCLNPHGGAVHAADSARETGSTETVSCTPERPLVLPGESIDVRLWAEPGRRVPVVWSASGGRIEGQDADARWTFTGVESGYYSATAREPGPAGATLCSIQVVVGLERGRRGPSLEAGHDLLAGGAPESEGYGLYTYVLLGAPPDDHSRERDLAVLQAFLDQVPAIADLDTYFDQKELNVTYVPLRRSPAGPLAAGRQSAEWLLEQYDFARARFLLKSLPGEHAGGPYLVSCLHPLSHGGEADGPYLVQDLSLVPANLVLPWLREFLAQAAQQHSWDEPSGKALVLKLRTAVGILAGGLADVRKGVHYWVSWTR